MSQPVSWKPEYTLNIRDIDEQHKRFFELINDIAGLAVSVNPPKDKAMLVLTHMGDYAYYHFDTEEIYFDKTNYAGKEEHKELHDAFRSKIADFIGRVRADETPLPELMAEVADFADHWLVNHILLEDKKYVECLKEKGIE